MGEKLITQTVLLGMLRGMLSTRSLRDVAKEIGVSVSLLHNVVEGKQAPGKRIPAFFGLEPTVLYSWKRNGKRLKTSSRT